MADALSDVTFPLLGRGETAAVTDVLPIRILSLSGTTIDERWHGDGWSSPEWRFYLDLDDGAEVRVGARRWPLRAGWLYAVPAWLVWSARCRGRVRHFNALVEVPGLPRERVISACRAVLPLAASDDPLAAEWRRLAVDLASCAAPTAAHIAHGHALVYAALARAMERLGPAAEDLLPTARTGRLSALLAWIERHLGESLGRAALARRAGCSPAELARRFHTELGTSPARWLRQRRVAVAAGLLRSTDLDLAAIAERCGLRDRSHLSRVFTRLCGSAPAAWRRWQQR